MGTSGALGATLPESPHQLAVMEYDATCLMFITNGGWVFRGRGGHLISWQQHSSRWCTPGFLGGNDSISMIRIRVNSLRELEERHPKGSCCYGNVCETPEGKFTLTLYPCGVQRLKEEDGQFLSLYLRCLSLSKGSIRSVQVDASFRIVKDDGTIFMVKAFSHLAWLSPGRVQQNPTSHPESGWEKFAKKTGPGLHPEFDSFTIEADLVVKAVAREPGVQDQGELGPWSEPEEVISRLIMMLKQSKLQQGADSQGQSSQGARVMTTDELSELSYEQLIEMQDNLNMAIVRTREKESKCPVCLDKAKDSVCVPCGHRYCNTCIAKLEHCAECRTGITNKIRCY